MVIFNSYVKLPEGTNYDRWITPGCWASPSMLPGLRPAWSGAFSTDALEGFRLVKSTLWLFNIAMI